MSIESILSAETYTETKDAVKAHGRYRLQSLPGVCKGRVDGLPVKLGPYETRRESGYEFLWPSWERGQRVEVEGRAYVVAWISLDRGDGWCIGAGRLVLIEDIAVDQDVAAGA